MITVPSDRSQRRWLIVLYVSSAVIVTIQRGVLRFPNDYAIFRASFWNLLHGRDLYALHLDQARDVFKYSPTFAALMAPLSLLPMTAGLLIWNLIGALSLVYAAARLLPEPKANIVLLLAYLPMLRNMQSTQSNTLITALIILSFVMLERGAHWRAALAVGIGAAIKIFPLAALSFAIPHRHRTRFVAWFTAIAIILLALPLLFTSTGRLAAQYHSWGVREGRDMQDYGESVMAMVQLWLGRDWAAWPTQLAGTIVLLLPLCFRPSIWTRSTEIRVRLLASVLVYCVIFNHKAEPQSYVIALTGIAIWYSIAPRSRWRMGLLAVVLILTSGLSPVPDFIKAPLTPLIRRPLPCFIAWIVMQVELIAAIHSFALDRDRDSETHRSTIHELDAALPDAAAQSR